MTTSTIAIAAATVAAVTPKGIFTGKGSQARTTALLQVAPLAFAEDTSRAASIDNLRVVLGKSPTDAQVKAAKTETTIGYVACRLPVSELPKGKTSPVDRLEYARDVVCRMGKAPQPGVRAKKLAKDKIGRRSPVQQRIVRNAEERTSQLFAELRLSNAKTQGERNKAKRAPSMAGSGKGKASAPALTQLATPAGPISSDDYVNHMQTQLAALVAYDSKHARKRPTTHSAFSDGLIALRQLGNKAANDYQVRKATAEAKAK